MMHPTHSKNAQGTQCLRCNVIDSEAAAKVPCPYISQRERETESRSRAADLRTLEQAEPLARTALAIVFYLRFGGRSEKWHVAQAYALADEFIAELKGDYQS